MAPPVTRLARIVLGAARAVVVATCAVALITASVMAGNTFYVCRWMGTSSLNRCCCDANAAEDGAAGERATAVCCEKQVFAALPSGASTSTTELASPATFVMAVLPALAPLSTTAASAPRASSNGHGHSPPPPIIVLTRRFLV